LLAHSALGSAVRDATSASRFTAPKRHSSSVPRATPSRSSALRHTTAMHLLQAGVDLSSIALWLGHVNPGTTHAYVEADLAMKERTLQKIAPPTTHSRRFRATDRLLTCLGRL
jgi:integrase